MLKHLVTPVSCSHAPQGDYVREPSIIYFKAYSKADFFPLRNKLQDWAFQQDNIFLWDVYTLLKG